MLTGPSTLFVFLDYDSHIRRIRLRRIHDYRFVPRFLELRERLLAFDARVELRQVGGVIAARLYDKTSEIQTSRKD